MKKIIKYLVEVGGGNNMEKKTKIKIVVFVVLFLAIVIATKIAEYNGAESAVGDVPFYKSYGSMNSGLFF